MDENVIDEATLKALRHAIGEEAMTDFVQRFFQDCEERTHRIIEAYGKSRFSEMELEAHTLGTAAATYGALKLEQICRDIECNHPSKDSVFDERIKTLGLLSDQSIQQLKSYF